MRQYGNEKSAEAHEESLFLSVRIEGVGRVSASYYIIYLHIKRSTFCCWFVKQFGFDAKLGVGDAVDILIYLAELFIARVLSNSERLNVVHSLKFKLIENSPYSCKLYAYG